MGEIKQLTVSELQALLNKFGRDLDAVKVFLHLVEEIGELSRLVKIHRTLIHAGRTKLKHELADVAIQTFYLASALGFDLAEAIEAKIKYNIQTGKFQG